MQRESGRERLRLIELLEEMLFTQRVEHNFSTTGGRV